MLRRFLNGVATGVGFVAVLAVAFFVAWAGDVFTVDKDGTLKFAVNDQGKITVGATESYVNLVIQNNAAAANNKVDVTADVLTVEGIRLETVNVSADLTVSGAGGLDTGAEAANTWYYVWVITNNNGTSSNGLLSTSSTAPTMPSGFTKKRRVGAVRNDGSSNFLRFVQEGGYCLYKDRAVVNRILTSGQATSFTDVASGSYIPPTSRKGTFRVQIGLSHNTAGVVFYTDVRGKGSGATIGSRVALTTQIVSTFILNTDIFETDIDSTQTIQYLLSSVPTGGGSGTTIDVCGYYDRI